jgi:very-short-patch-repair endonuclease
MQQDTKQTQRARELRTNANPLEDIVWQHLKSRRLGGFKFRRQHPVEMYIVDFVCLEAKVILELDGASHDGREDHDEKRQLRLEQAGFLVLRFRNEVVYENLEGMLDRVWEQCLIATGQPREMCSTWKPRSARDALDQKKRDELESRDACP